MYQHGKLVWFGFYLFWITCCCFVVLIVLWLYVLGTIMNKLCVMKNLWGVFRYLLFPVVVISYHSIQYLCNFLIANVQKLCAISCSIFDETLIKMSKLTNIKKWDILLECDHAWPVCVCIHCLSDPIRGFLSGRKGKMYETIGCSVKEVRKVRSR